MKRVNTKIKKVYHQENQRQVRKPRKKLNLVFIESDVNKFTGMERDQETGYDYFGARYYDSRISVWLSPDPLFEKHLQWSPYNYVLRNPFVLIDPDGRQVHFSDEEKSRNLELNRYKHLLPEKYRQNIDITVNEKNEYILDHDLLLKANIDENEGVYINYKILLYLSSSSQMTNARFVNKEDLFVANIVNPRATINTSLSIMEKDLNIIYHGYTFVSNTVDNDQKPLFFSSCEDVNEIYIPLEDSELEQTKSLGHELDHVYRYLKNLNWKNEESDEFLNRELKNIESIIEKNY
jgi:RHS repeat-associated protein